MLSEDRKRGTDRIQHSYTSTPIPLQCSCLLWYKEAKYSLVRENKLSKDNPENKMQILRVMIRLKGVHPWNKHLKTVKASLYHHQHRVYELQSESVHLPHYIYAKCRIQQFHACKTSSLSELPSKLVTEPK